MKLALALACLVALAGGASAADHRRSLKALYDQEKLICDTSVAQYLAAESASSGSSFGVITVGTDSGIGEMPSGKAAAFALTTGPNGGGVKGSCARNLCIALGKFRGIQLQVANLEAGNIHRVAGPLLYDALNGSPSGPNAYINTAPGYETPRDIVNKTTSGPVGRNNLVLTASDPAGDYNIAPLSPPPPTKAQTPGEGAASLPVVCGPPRDPIENQPDFCTNPDDEFQGWAISTESFTAADIVCPFGYDLGNVAANNLFKSDQTKWNGFNLFDQTGFPYLQDLIAICAPGQRVWVNTAPGFTSGNPAGAPPGSPGYCVTISEGPKGMPQGVNPKYTGGKPVPNDPKCLETHKALCFLSSAV